MLLQIVTFIFLPILTFIVLKEIELGTPDIVYIVGISMLGSSVFSVDKMDELRKAYTFTTLLYMTSTVFVVWGFFIFDWYLVLMAMWIGSYYLYFLRRMVWLRLCANGNSGLENVNWDNFYILIGALVTLGGLLTK